jgi:penicillin-insensitive murein endopeptidase
MPQLRYAASMRRRIGSLILAVAAFTAAVAHAAPTTPPAKPRTAKPTVAPPSGAKPGTIATRSVGAPNNGSLVGGSHLEIAPHLRIVPAYAAGDARWGLHELVGALDRAAREVRKRFPDAVLGVGHLSRKGGGVIDRHRSHESGRDADVAFYMVDVAGRAASRDAFVAVGPDGLVVGDPKLRFDEGRNWAFVSALLRDPKARVTHVFVANHLRTRLLAYAARVGAPLPLRARAAEVLMQPHRALPHDDHFHVRIACPGGAQDCVEFPVSARRGPKTTLAKATPKPKPPTKKLVRARSTLGTNGPSTTKPVTTTSRPVVTRVADTDSPPNAIELAQEHDLELAHEDLGPADRPDDH